MYSKVFFGTLTRTVGTQGRSTWWPDVYWQWRSLTPAIQSAVEFFSAGVSVNVIQDHQECMWFRPPRSSSRLTECAWRDWKKRLTPDHWLTEWSSSELWLTCCSLESVNRQSLSALPEPEISQSTFWLNHGLRNGRFPISEIRILVRCMRTKPIL